MRIPAECSYSVIGFHLLLEITGAPLQGTHLFFRDFLSILVVFIPSIL